MSEAAQTLEPNTPTEPVEPQGNPEPTAQAPVEPAKPSSVLEGSEAPAEGDKPQQAAQDWPDDWRTKLAGDDEKALKKLERFNSINDVLKYAQNLEKKMSSGEFKRSLPEDASEEDIKQWRVENGVPESADGYDLDVDGLVVGEDDKPYLDEFLKTAHESNMPNDQVKQVVAWHYQNLEKQQQERAEADSAFTQESMEALRSEWGGEYKQNINMIKGLLSSAPEGFAERIMSARLGDDKPLGSDPEALKWLAGMARQINPVATVVPNAGGNQAGAIQDEISQINKTMRENPNAYWKDEKMQARMRELLSAQERMK